VRRYPIPNSTSRSGSLLAELRAVASRYLWQYLVVTDALGILPSYQDRPRHSPGGGPSRRPGP
jgi:hypothetical protein